MLEQIWLIVEGLEHLSVQGMREDGTRGRSWFEHLRNHVFFSIHHFFGPVDVV
jgi:hypothetical protein